MSIVKKTICMIVCLCVWIGSYAQVPSRIPVSSITPTVSTGMNYTPWLNDDITNLVANVWTSINMQYIDVKLKLQNKANITKLSFFDWEGDFTAQPALIYAVNGSTRTYIGSFLGTSYNVWVDLNLPTPLLTDTIIIHKYGNNIPEKIKIYGIPAVLSTPITGYGIVCAGATTTMGNATSGGTWSSSNTAIATVASTGIVTGVSGGTSTISYTVSGASATTTVTVNPIPNAGSITGSTTLCPTGTATLSNTVTGGTWSSTAPGVATISTAGIVTGISAGNTTISYSVTNGCGTRAATKVVTVNASPVAGTISGTTTISAGATTLLSTTGTGGIWSSAAPGVATVGPSGLVTGVSAGTATISYTVTNSCSSATTTKLITVSSSVLSTPITGYTIACTGSTTSLGNATWGGVWNSGNTAIATINSSTGIVTGVSPGTVVISYTITGLTATTTVTINPSANPGTITGTAAICTGGISTLSASGGTGGGTWSSSATGVATVNSSGVVTGVSSGTATISYSVVNSCGVAAATKLITVSSSPGAGTITGTTGICPGSTTTLSASVVGGTWSSSATGVATVNTSGVVTGVAAGTATISYTVVSSCGTATVTQVENVTSSPGAGTITGTTGICPGSTTILSASVGGGTWSSSATGVATVNTSGVVTGVAVGTATISYTVVSSCGTATATQVENVTSSPAAGTITGSATVTSGSTTLLSNTVMGGVWSSSATGIATVNTSGLVTGVSAGSATISYTVTGSCGTAVATHGITVNLIVGGGLVHGIIPIDSNRWYQLNNCSNGLGGLFDGNLSASVSTGWGKILTNYDAYYPVLKGEIINIDSIKFYDGPGSNESNPFTLYYIDSLWNRVQIASFIGTQYNAWVGPDPSNPFSFNLPVPANNIKYLLISCSGAYPNEMQLYGSYAAPAVLPAAAPKTITLGQEFGVNGFEWNFEDPANPLVVDTTRMAAAKSFTGLRHYLDWQKLEPTEGGYTFNPSHSGSWNYDTMYARCKIDGIEVLADIKTLPDWMVSTYPVGQQDAENIPVLYGGDFSNPASYTLQAKVAFQFAARYGNNASVSTSLLSVDGSTRWSGDPANTIKKGLGLVKYMECDNERDKWWKGRKAYQTGREYAANLSAFYDGNKNTMGPGVGVKNADSTMKVVMGGVASPTPDFFRGMIDWCKEFRGYKPDGSVNLCWDVINYHIYCDNGGNVQGAGTSGAAPEVAHADTIALNFINAAHAYAQDMPVWVTETGYDINQGSVLKAYPIGAKSTLQTQADWILRTSLLNARMGIERTFFYEMYDDDTSNSIKFSSSGLINPNKTRKPAADYLYQTNKLLGNYVYKETISTNPLVDRYELDGQSVYALVKPSQNGSTMSYTLNVGYSGSVRAYSPVIGQDSMNFSTLSTVADNVTLTVGETPMFVTPATGTVGHKQPFLEIGNTAGNTLEQSSIVVYPNPTTGQINFSIDNQKEGDVNITIYDASGRSCRKDVFKKEPGKFTDAVNIGNLPNGLYLMEIGQGNDKVIKKIIKVNN